MRAIFFLLVALLPLADSFSAADELNDNLTQYRELIAKKPKSRSIDEKTALLKLGDRLFLWAKKNPMDEQSNSVLLTLCSDRPLGAQAAGAIRLLLERDPGSAAWADLCEPIGEAAWSDAEAILKELAEKSSHAAVRGAALWSLSKRTLAAIGDIDPLDVKSIAGQQQIATRRLQTLAKISEPVMREETDLRDLAKAKLEVLQRNALGLRAPEVSGEALDGKSISLTSYRGKVVVLIFWGAWCPICREQIPAELALATKYEGKPVALLGVNSDTELETAIKTAKEEGLAWPSYFDGGSTRGPIARQWGIDFWPTVILLDHRGVIRYRMTGMKKVDEAVAILLKEI